MKENNEINSNKKDSKLKLVITILLIIILIGTTAYFAYNYFKIKKAQENLNNNSTKNQEVITPTNNANDVENNNNNNLVNTILENEGGASAIISKQKPNFSEVSTTDEGMFSSIDNYGTSYYYRGAVKDNNVIFGGFCWKIVRINGDNTTRMIYNGNQKNGTCVLSGTDTQINNDVFNEPKENDAENNAYDDNALVGYMYGTTNANSYDATHSNTNESNVKKIIDKWYKVNLTNYSKNISDNIFCNDRSISEGSGIGKSETTYGFTSGINSKSLYTPSNVCGQQSDSFTNNDKNNGNGKLTYPIGLITSDELLMAGAITSDKNTDFYLYSGSAYWTSTPISFGFPMAATVDSLDETGRIADNRVDVSSGIRPVINIINTAKFTSGNGTNNSPYIIEE